MRIVDADSFAERVNVVFSFSGNDLSDDFVNGAKIVLDMLKSHPTAVYPRETAYWIDGKYWSHGAGMAEHYGRYAICSKCKKTFSYRTHFCSCCGSEMTNWQDKQ